MKVEIIAIGDELLIGQTVNTNAAWMGAQLSEAGFSIEYCTVIRDERAAMLEAFERALSRVDIVLTTGGLGPTQDDITKQVLCDFFACSLREDRGVLENVKAMFASRGREMQEVHARQALIPAVAEALNNQMGTAPGIWIKSGAKIMVSMPGVPYEMKYLMTTHVLPRLIETFSPTALYYRTVQIQGLGESWIAERIQDIETDLRSAGLGLAYLPSPGLVRLRFSGLSTDEVKDKIAASIEEVKRRLPVYVFGEGNDELSEVVGNLLREKGATVSTAESCTGGSVAAALVAVPGSTDYFMGSIVSYSNDVKINSLGVDQNAIEEHGAVSREVVEQMALGARGRLNTDYSIALSGVAGPDGGTEEKPVGTVWIAVAGPQGVHAKCFRFETNRQRNIQRAVLTALNLLRCELLEINIEKS